MNFLIILISFISFSFSQSDAVQLQDKSEEMLAPDHISMIIHEDLINELLEIMRQTLESGDNLMVTNFGLFELKDKVARPGRDPKSKVEHRIDARRVISFHPAKTWREELNQ